LDMWVTLWIWLARSFYVDCRCTQIENTEARFIKFLTIFLGGSIGRLKFSRDVITFGVSLYFYSQVFWKFLTGGPSFLPSHPTPVWIYGLESRV
jgi:hypothetical protein